MASRVGRVVEQLRHLLASDGRTLRDADLLRRFAATRDETAFAVLVERHGPMVFGVCRRVLESTHDAEDAFQATFLVLARRATALGQLATVAGWLCGVAYRVARKMKMQRLKRAALEPQVRPPAPAAPPDLAWRELLAVLDEELQRLGEGQRLPLVLCYLQGLTQEEAAKQLGWPRGTLKRRLERGRDVLKLRLTRRGLSLAAGLAATLTTGDGLTAAPPARLTGPLPPAAALFACKKPLPATLAAVHVVAFAEGVLKSMFAAKLKLLAAVCASVVVLGCAALVYAHTAQPQDAGSLPVPVPAPSSSVQSADQNPGAGQQDRDRFEGTWRVVEYKFEGANLAGNKNKITFKDNTFRLETNLGDAKGTFTVNSKGTPPHIDLQFAGRRAAFEAFDGVPVPPEPLATAMGKLYRANRRNDELPGIYEFSGRLLTFCLTLPIESQEGNVKIPARPKQISAAKGSGILLILLEREQSQPPDKNDKAKDTPGLKGDAAKLQGVWDVFEIEVMSMSQNGAGATVTFEGEDYIYRSGPDSYLKGKFKLDESKDPRWIDIAYYETKMPAATPPVAQSTAGAYKLAGDKMTLALGFAADSKEAQGLPRAGRPTEFKTGPGTGAFVLHLARRNTGKEPKRGATKEIPLGKRWTGSYGTEHNPARLVIRNEKQWSAVWSKSMGAEPETPVSPQPEPMPKVDFSTHMVLAVFMGDRENGGHVVNITRVEQKDDVWTVYVHEASPPPGGTPKITQQPFCLVVVPRHEGKVTFVDDEIKAKPPKEPGEEVRIRKQWSEDLSRWHDKGEMVVRDLDAWKVAWARASAAQFPVPALPGIDFEKEMVLAVFMGTQASSHHAVEVTGVARTPTELQVHVRYTFPAQGQVVQTWETAPSCLVVVPHFKGKVVFITDNK
jgi:RNA polymerase sigma factor (sigma-70 family)